jgi:hypothetical protein
MAPSRRRLSVVLDHIAFRSDATAAANNGAHPTTAAVRLSSVQDVIQQLLPLPIRRRPTADVSPEAGVESDWLAPDCTALRAAIAEASREGNFRLAALLQDLAFVVEPKRPLRVGDCAPADPTTAAEFFRTNGFVAVPQLFGPAVLKRLQAAWRRAQAPARALWEESKALGCGANGIYFENQAELNSDPRFKHLPHGRLFFDIPVEEFFFAEALQPDGDPVMLQLLDPPKLMAVLRQIIGDDVVCVGVQPRTVPPEDGGGYTTWHNDSHAGVGWQDEQIGQGVAKRTVKAFIYLNDVEADQGCTSVVRGSHLLSPIGIRPNMLFDWDGSGSNSQTVFAGNDVGRTVANGYAPLASFPNHVKFAARAGDGLIFDLATFHTAQPNVSRLERWNTIQGYHSASILGQPRPVGGTPTGPIMSDNMLRRLARAGKLTVAQRRILNMPTDDVDSDAWPRYNARGQLRGTGEVDGSAQR